jgi:hypothetical protein
MISSENFTIVSWLINAEDLTLPLDTFTRITLVKPEIDTYVKIGIVPDITLLSGGNIAFSFCLVTLPNENLPFGDVNLQYAGEYFLNIETSPDGITWTNIWRDLFRLLEEEITYYGL